MAFLAVALASAGILAGRERTQRNAEKTYEALREKAPAPVRDPQEAEKAEGTETEAETETEETDPLKLLGVEIPEKNLDWDALREENGDIYAWIYVPDTDVDYPVLQHPSDDSYYLDHNLDGSKGLPGCIYTEAAYTAKDFSDIHTVLYGHNLKDHTMFSTLHNFEDEELFGRDHYIFIYTEETALAYRIFAAYEYQAIHLLDNFDYDNEYVYADYLKNIYRTADPIANVREDIEVTAADRILTLSTCTTGVNYDTGMRFLVTGVLINPGGLGET